MPPRVLVPHATCHGRCSCGLSRIARTSFYPSKPLGAYGDGGTFFTDGDELGAQVRWHALSASANLSRYMLG
ncbi:DegT/DnrJ/EryC1/StrS family aminotransferase [Halomonas sp. DQ26W]|uniref:DegT/DnrJ/EryC1/StrS family aminotransferase n=1 Tax=Halomonas sp. DQ26W TaxID=2282311 RepID=UPI00286807F8|nr:DegT/DnrJ/EryC1/StrS family aminotransferase [Halomonas sp. DQ26W]